MINKILTILHFFENIIQTLVSCLKILLLSKFNLPKFTNSQENASILGNGPSLNQSLTENLTFIQNTDIYCVNNFASASVYTTLKPQNYIMLDPAFFMYNPSNAARKDIEMTLTAILNQTTWEMRYFVPAKFRNSYIVSEIKKQKPNIQVLYFNYTIIKGFTFLKHWLFDKHLGMPQCQNILAATLYVALSQQYKKIFLFGADHSWHEEIRISEANELEMRQLHFYDNVSTTKHQAVVDVRDNSKPKLHAQFLSLHKAFYAYEVLKKYANYKNIQVFNASKKSYIDTFERVKL